MNTSLFTRRTGRNVAVGALVGVVASFVPFVTFVAPLLAGGVSGYLERAGARRGAVVGAVVGLLVAVVTSVLSLGGALANVDLGAIGTVPVAGLLVAGTLWTAAVVGQTFVTALGGALGGVVEADREKIGARLGTDADAGSRSRLAVALASVLVGGLAFVAVGLGVTALLDPYIWPSLLVGIPVGAIAGATAAVLSYHVLVTRTGGRGRDQGRTPGAS